MVTGGVFQPGKSDAVAVTANDRVLNPDPRTTQVTEMQNTVEQLTAVVYAQQTTIDDLIRNVTGIEEKEMIQLQYRRHLAAQCLELSLRHNNTSLPISAVQSTVSRIFPTLKQTAQVVYGRLQVSPSTSAKP